MTGEWSDLGHSILGDMLNSLSAGLQIRPTEDAHEFWLRATLALRYAGSMTNRLRLCACLAGIVAALTGPAAAGKLSDFEKSVDDGGKSERVRTDSGRERAPRSRDDYSPDFGDLLGDELVEFLCGAVIGGIVYGGTASMERVRGGDSQFDARQSGEALIPHLALDVNYLAIEGDVTAWDFRGEAGFGAIACAARRTRYEEGQERLDTTELLGLYRMSAGAFLEVDIGCGALRVSGEEIETGFAFTLPVRLHPTDYIGVEYRPLWSSIEETRITSHELSLLCGWRYAGLRVGYRWLSTAGETLNGPEVGLALRW